MSAQRQLDQEKAYKEGAYTYAKDKNVIFKHAAVAGFIYYYLKENAKIIDLGCGYSNILSCICNFQEYTGIDFSSSAIAESTSLYNDDPRVHLYVDDILEFKPEKGANCIVWLGVSAHFEQIEDVFIKYARVLEPNGLFIFESTHDIEKLVDTAKLKITAGLSNINGCHVKLTKLEYSKLLGLGNSYRKIEVFRKG